MAADAACEGQEGRDLALTLDRWPADTADGQSCTGGAIGTPFYAFTDNATGPQQLFTQGYTPRTTTTGAASAVTRWEPPARRL